MLSNQQPYATAELAYATVGSARKLTITATGEMAGRWEIVQDGNTTTLRSGLHNGGSGEVAESKTVITKTTQGTSSTFERVVSPDSGAAVARSTETRDIVTGEERVIGHTSGATSQGLIKSCIYYTDSTLVGAKLGGLRAVLSNRDAWQHFSYDSTGRLTRIVSQFKSNAFELPLTDTELNQLAAQNHEVRIAHYAIDTSLDSDTLPEIVEEATEFVQNVAVSRTIKVTWSQPESGATQSRAWRVRCEIPTPAASAAAMTTLIESIGVNAPFDTKYLVDIEVREPEFPFELRVLSQSNGRVTRYTRTESNGIKTVQADEGPGTADRKEVRTGTGTRTITHKPLRGEITAQELYDLSTTTPTLISSRTSTADDFGRVTSTTHSNGTTTTRQYSCCGLESDTDAFGVITGYEYDALHRLTKTIRQVGPSSFIATEYVMDAAGRVIEEWKRGTDGTTLALVSTSEYDLSGQLIATEDASGVRTDYSESVITYGGSSLVVQNITTLPPMEHNQQTIRPEVVSLQYMDGSPLSRSGNGAHETHSDHGVVVDPVDGVLRFTQSWNGDSSSSEWTKQYSNTLGQQVKTEFADGSVQRTYYNDRGQVYRTVDPDGVTTLSYRGNGWEDAQALSAPSLGTDAWKGEWQVNVAHAAATGWNGTSIAWGGKDRIRRTRSFVGAPSTASGITDSYCFVTLSDEWSVDNDASTVVQTAASYSSFDGRTRFQESFGQTSKTVESAPNPLDLGFERTVSTVGSQVVTSDRRYGRATTVLSEEGGQFKTKVEYGYDLLGRQTSVSEYFTAAATVPTNVTTTSYVGLTDRVATITQPPPATGQPALATTNEYDTSGRVIRVELTGSKEVFQSFLPTGEKGATSGFGVNPVVYSYNDQGRLSTLTTFKDGGTASGLAVTTWTYDSERGWLSEKTYDNGKGWTYTYTPAGRLSSRTSASPRSILTSYYYNEFGELQETTYSDDTQSVVQLFDRRGRLKTVIDAAGVRTITRDDAGQMLSESFAADGNSPNLLDGVVVTNTPISGHVGQRSAHEVELSSYPLNAVAFEYDAADRLWRVTKDSRRAEFAYNLRTGQVSGQTHSSLVGSTYTPYINLSRVLDNLGRVSSMLYTRSSDNGTLSSTLYTYDVYGRRTLGDRDMHDGFEKGARWHYAYDELNQLTSAKRELNGYPGDFAPGQQYEYAYDDIGNRTSTKIGGDQQGNNLVSSTYTSNLLNQYTERQVPGRIDITGDAPEYSVVEVNNTIAYRAGRYFWHVIPVNNATEPVVQEVTTEIIPGDPAWQRFMVSKTPETFTYDADGNLTQDGTFVYEWDGENRLKAIITRYEIGEYITPFRLDFAYDYMGRRIMKRYSRYEGDFHDLVETPGGELKSWAADYEQRFVWDGGLSGGYGNLSASFFYDSVENVFAGAGQSYAWGPDLSGTEQGAGGIGGLAIISAATSLLSQTAATYVPLYDGHGNVVSLRDTSTNELAAYTYGPYGETTAAVGSRWASNPFRFSTKFTDAETGLVYYGYRYYTPSVGRWASRDPMNESGGLNLIAFTGNNPIVLGDADGRYAIDFHYYVIYYLFRVKCYAPAIAHQIAHASQRVDATFSHVNPLTLGALGGLSWPTLQSNIYFSALRDFHFWGSSETVATSRDPWDLRLRWRSALWDGDYDRAGRYLHTYADSWAHESFSAWPSSRLNRRLGRFGIAEVFYMGHLDTGHGGTEPDLPYTDIEKAFDAALRIDELIPSRNCCNSSVNSTEFVNDLYLMFSTSNDNADFRAEVVRRVIRRRFGEYPTY